MQNTSRTQEFLKFQAHIRTKVEKIGKVSVLQK